MDDNALQKLSDSIANFQLSEDAAKTLYEIAIDPHGVERRTAHSLVASILDISVERSNQAIIELMGNNFLILNDNNNESRLFANYDLLEIDESLRNRLLSRREIFDNMKEAHSQISLKSLDDFFTENLEPIYLGCEVSSHHTFRKLKERAEDKKLTVFLMPRKKDVPISRHTHYDEMLSEWVHFFKEGSNDLKKYIRIRITRRPFPQLYTSGLCNDKARLNLYLLNDKTTRRGALLQVNKGTSLYQLIFDNYQEAIRSSYPLWRLWPFEAIRYWLLKTTLPIILIAFGIILSELKNPIPMAFSAIFIGLVVNIIWDKIGQKF